MSASPMRRDDGFIAIDALAACVTVALTGIVIATTAIGLLQRQDNEFDRSIALVEIQSLARQVELFGAHAWPRDFHEGEFRYEIEVAPFADSGRLESVTITAHRLRANTILATVTILVPIPMEQ